MRLPPVRLSLPFMRCVPTPTKQRGQAMIEYTVATLMLIYFLFMMDEPSLASVVIQKIQTYYTHFSEGISLP